MPQFSPPFIEKWLAGPDGQQFYTRTYQAAFPEAVVLFVHGFIEHIERYRRSHAKYAACNITMFAFDLRGYGRTALDVIHKSKSSEYGQTSWELQLADIEHFGRYLSGEYPGLPLFLMGHSAGAAQNIAYFTRLTAPPTLAGTRLFTGVICTSPWLTLTAQKPAALRWIGSVLAAMFPHMLVPAPIEVAGLSRDAGARDAYVKDPMVKQFASLRILVDMFTGGEELVKKDWEYWPKNLPILLIHGTADRITDPDSTKKFYEEIDAIDKQLCIYAGGYHELFHDIDDIPDRLVNDSIAWIKARIPKKSAFSNKSEVAVGAIWKPKL